MEIDIEKLSPEELKAFLNKILVARGYQKAIREILLYLKGRLNPDDGHIVRMLEEMSDRVSNLKTFDS